MNQKLKKMTALIVCCLMFSLASCSNEVSTTENSTTATTQATTQAATTQPSAENTTVATTQATTQATTTTTAQATTQATTTQATTETKVEKSDIKIEQILADLQSVDTISANPDKVTAIPTISENNVEIEKVETFGDNFVVVTLNGRLDKVDTTDIVLKKYSDNWYSLSPTTSIMKTKDSYSTINDEGKTVIIYSTNDTIKGTKVVTDTSEKKFSNLAAEIVTADNYLSWQMDHGGWDKGVEDQAKTAWTAGVKKNKSSGWTAKNGQMIGTIDNDATYTQMRQIAAVYREVKDEKYKESVLKGLDFIFKLQYESGGFAQVYPERGNYSDYVTFNDNAMVNVLIMLEDMKNKAYPFDSDIIPDEYMAKIEESINKGIDFILKSQIKVDGKLTAWCAQHDPVTYEPRGARAYELPSISGSESVGVVKFLMNQEQTPEIKNAVDSAIQWFKDSEVKGIKYIKNDPNKVYFVEDANSSLWYRFYDIETNLPIFCDRDGVKKHSITEIGEERRNGYSWSGSYPRKLITVYDQFNGENYACKIEAAVINTNSSTADNKTLTKNAVKMVTSEIISK